MEKSTNWQPLELRDKKVLMEPLQWKHFEELFAVASDPLVWAQHPNPDRYRREVFQTFFEGGLASSGAFIIRSTVDGAAIGCTRFYDHDTVAEEVKIGYTFFARSCWGLGYNPAVKRLMLAYAFQHVERVVFHVGTGNIRSQRAIERLGARKTGEIDIAYHGEPVKRNFVYEVTRDQLDDGS